MSLSDQVRERPFTILHLSDSVNEAIALRSQLRNAGYQGNVVHADGFDQILEQVRKSSVDVILVDLGGHSIEMVETIAAESAQENRLADLPIVVFSDLDEESQVLALYEAGAHSVVTNEAFLDHVLIREVAASLDRQSARQLQQQLNGAEMRCQKLIDGSSEAVAYIKDGLHIYANEAYLGLFGFHQLDDLIDEPLLDLAVGDAAGRLKQFLREGEGSDEFEFRTEGGDTIHVIATASHATFDGEDCLQLFMARKHDDAALEQLEYFARRDLLTGLYNRNYFFEQLHERQGQLKESEAESAALLLLEVSNIAELKGHLGTTGIDSLLTEFGKQVEEIVGGRGIVARHGAYSFLILVGKSDPVQVRELADALVDHIKAYVFSQGDLSVSVNAAIGYTMVDNASPGSNELVDRVERATNTAALRGANQVEQYQPDLKSASDEEQEEAWARRIKTALKENRFQLAFQPIVSLGGDRETSRYEVFLRMLDEDGSSLNPQEFILRAERGELIQSIDRWVVLSALKQIKTAAKQGEKIQLYIRISEQSLRDPEFAKWLSGRLTAVRLDDVLLMIQVRAETAGYLLKQIESLRDSVSGLGCDIVIDSFGEGSNPFRILDHLKTPVIKISRPLMERFSGESANQEVVHGLVQSAKERELQIIVPNVEDAASLQILWPMGVDFVQGDFIQGPRENLEFDFSQF